jgi:hypothetical protein
MKGTARVENARDKIKIYIKEESLRIRRKYEGHDINLRTGVNFQCKQDVRYSTN